MNCPLCYHFKTLVLKTRHNRDKNITARRRICECCKLRFTTHEYPTTLTLKKPA